MFKTVYLKMTGVLVAILMLAGLIAGCGGGGDSAKDSKEIKIGVIFELTGNTASYGKTSLNAAQNGV